MNPNRYLIRIFTLLIAILPMATDTWAQFRQIPINSSSEEKRESSPNFRKSATVLSLPVWDDFSAGSIDTLLWEAKGVLASKTIGINPPTVGVVYLDGMDRNGNPYSRNLLENGDGDQLTSWPIDLSGISQEEINSIYLSFFWQPGGHGEFPDENDRLELLFLDDNGAWIPVWSAEGGDEDLRDRFFQNLIKVDEEFLHENFRFRFQCIGRLSGPFDTWILDYIYLNKNRSPADIYYEDRALTQLSTGLFGKYNAIPLFYFNVDPENYLSIITNQFNNLSNRFRAMEFSMQLINRNDASLLSTVHLNTPIDPVPQARERRNFSSRFLDDLGNTQLEEFDLEILTYLTTGDNYLVNEAVQGDTTYFPQIDYRINDTVRTIVPIRDFLAYDDGMVDYSAGINQRTGMLALRYEQDVSAFIKGISINFTNFSQIGSALEIMVWNNLESPPVFKKEFLIPEKSNLNDFSYFPIDTNIRLSPTFYIGFTQFTNDFIHIGLDKSQDNGEEVFYNVTGDWEQNESVLGSLMIRPHLSIEPPVAATGNEEENSIRAYPNPVTEILYLEGTTDEIKIYDFYGREIKLPVDNHEKGKYINFVGTQKGFYLLKIHKEKKVHTIKILVE